MIPALRPHCAILAHSPTKYTAVLYFALKRHDSRSGASWCNTDSFSNEIHVSSSADGTYVLSFGDTGKRHERIRLHESQERILERRVPILYAF